MARAILCCLFLMLPMTSAAPVTNSDAMSYLMHFGYAPTPAEGALMSIDFGAMLSGFQEHFGLAATGKVDEATIKLMETPRCGMIDENPRRGKRGVKVSKWTKPTVKYFVVNYPNQKKYTAQHFSQEYIDSVMKTVFGDWKRFTSGLNFEKASSEKDADIRLSFHEYAEHNRWCKPAFYESTNAHATLPENGTIHVNLDAAFNDAAKMHEILLHEVGHTLGLLHDDSSSKNVMHTYHFPGQKIFADATMDKLRALYPPYNAVTIPTVPGPTEAPERTTPEPSEETTTKPPSNGVGNNYWVYTTLGGPWKSEHNHRKVLIVTVPKKTELTATLEKTPEFAGDNNDMMVAIHRYVDGTFDLESTIAKSERSSNDKVSTGSITLRPGKYLLTGYSFRSLWENDFGMETVLRLMSSESVSVMFTFATPWRMYQTLVLLLLEFAKVEEHKTFTDRTLYADNGMMLLIDNNSDKYLHYHSNMHTSNNIIAARGNAQTFDSIPPKSRQIIAILSRDDERSASDYKVSTSQRHSSSSALGSDWSGGKANIAHRPGFGLNEQLFGPIAL